MLKTLTNSQKVGKKSYTKGAKRSQNEQNGNFHRLVCFEFDLLYKFIEMQTIWKSALNWDFRWSIAGYLYLYILVWNLELWVAEKNEGEFNLEHTIACMRM